MRLGAFRALCASGMDQGLGAVVLGPTWTDSAQQRRLDSRPGGLFEAAITLEVTSSKHQQASDLG